MAECTYDIRDRHPWLAGLDHLTPSEFWRTAKQAKRVKGYRRFTYRYRAFNEDRLSDILLNSRLYLASPSTFNDPFEMRPVVTFDGPPSRKRDALDKRIRALEPRLGGVKRRERVDALMSDQSLLLKTMRDSLRKNFDDSGVASFADDPTDNLMWSHYAGQHTGVCIQFEIAGSPSRLLAAVSVKYRDRYPKINWIEDTAAQLREIVFTKSLHWQYERERRIFCPGCAGTTYSFDPKACTAVTVGCRTKEHVVDFLRRCNDARARRGWPTFKLFRAVCSEERFLLRIHPIR